MMNVMGNSSNNQSLTVCFLLSLRCTCAKGHHSRLFMRCQNFVNPSTKFLVIRGGWNRGRQTRGWRLMSSITIYVCFRLLKLFSPPLLEMPPMAVASNPSVGSGGSFTLPQEVVRDFAPCLLPYKVHPFCHSSCTPCGCNVSLCSENPPVISSQWRSLSAASDLVSD